MLVVCYPDRNKKVGIKDKNILLLSIQSNVSAYLESKKCFASLNSAGHRNEWDLLIIVVAEFDVMPGESLTEGVVDA